MEIITDPNSIAAEPSNKNSGSSFEEAISATNFGRFNYLLLAAAIPFCVSPVFQTTTISYVLPNAECDLHLSLVDRGRLNGIGYAGMIVSAVFWGYLSDTLGRRKLLIYGYTADAICVFLSGFSQNQWQLMIFKFFGGFFICGPFAIVMTYISEFHGVKHRSRVMMLIGLTFSMGTIILPSIGWIILPSNWNLYISDYIELKSWQLYILITSIPSILSAILVYFFPESPKFLMSRGKNDEALDIFRNVFTWNTNKSSEEYPIKCLVNELAENSVPNKKTTETTNGYDAFKNGVKQIRPMFSKPYLGYTFLVYTIQFGLLLGLNTVRLWLPQLLKMMSDFDILPDSTKSSLGEVNLCKMLEFSAEQSEKNYNAIDKDELCSVYVPGEIYLKSILVGMTSLVGYLIAGGLINACGSKNILIFGLFIPSISGFCLYFAENSSIALVLSALYVSVGSISSTALVGVTVNLFPTTFRAMLVSLVMMFGRLGALIGNVAFPYLLELGCLPPFLMIGIIMLACSCLCILLPQTNKKPLE